MARTHACEITWEKRREAAAAAEEVAATGRLGERYIFALCEQLELERKQNTHTHTHTFLPRDASVANARA